MSEKKFNLYVEEKNLTSRNYDKIFWLYVCKLNFKFCLKMVVLKTFRSCSKTHLLRTDCTAQNWFIVIELYCFDPPPPHVSFGDTVATTTPPPFRVSRIIWIAPYLIRNIDEGVSRKEGESMKSDDHKLLWRVPGQDLHASFSNLGTKAKKVKFIKYYWPKNVIDKMGNCKV